eukprot:1161430-Pelagomonas_calceolata.AAC.5
MPAVQTAVRTGCLVISYAATASQICGLEDLCADTLAVAKDWAHEHGLLEAGQESMLSVQSLVVFWAKCQRKGGTHCRGPVAGTNGKVLLHAKLYFSEGIVTN